MFRILYGFTQQQAPVRRPPSSSIPMVRTLHSFVQPSPLPGKKIENMRGEESESNQRLRRRTTEKLEEEKRTEGKYTYVDFERNFHLDAWAASISMGFSTHKEFVRAYREAGLGIWPNKKERVEGDQIVLSKIKNKKGQANQSQEKMESVAKNSLENPSQTSQSFLLTPLERINIKNLIE